MGCLAALWKSFERLGALRAQRMDGPRRSQNRRPRFAGGFRPRLQRGDVAAGMDLTKIAFLMLLAGVGLERLVELQLSRRHQHKLASNGARKHGDPQYRWMIALHTGVLVGAAVEVTALHRPFIPWLAFPALVLFALATLLRC